MKPNKDKHCGVCDPHTFERNHYYYGKQLTVRDLLQEQCYFNQKRRLINRMVLGWGVICGLDVCWDEKAPFKFKITPGLALDCCGREILVCQDQNLELNPLEKFDEVCPKPTEQQDYQRDFVICLEYDECKTEPVEFPPAECDQQRPSEYNRIRDWFKLTIKSWEEASHKRPGESDICLSQFEQANLLRNNSVSCETATIHDRLCASLKAECPECKCRACVVLAKITLKKKNGQEKSKEPMQSDSFEVTLDRCSERRLIYSNDLLYGLINCYHGDLPHIVGFSWKQYTRPNREISWENFVTLIQTGLTVTFDQEMNADSFTPHTFFVSFTHVDEGTGSIIEKRIPVQDFTKDWDSSSHCYKTTLNVEPDWINDELNARHSQLAEGVDVEVTLRGDQIFNCERTKALDGNFLADKLPTGNGTQGGDFVDWFRVLPKD